MELIVDNVNRVGIENETSKRHEPRKGDTQFDKLIVGQVQVLNVHQSVDIAQRVQLQICQRQGQLAKIALV